MKKRMAFFLSMLVTVTVGLIPAAESAAATDFPISIETMFDRAFLEKLSTPQYEWLQDGRILLLDSRVEPGARTFELLDPRTMQRQTFTNPGKILAGFKEYLAENAPTGLTWPDALDPKSKRAVYNWADDLFLVELETGSVKRLTRTPAGEESVAFSPNGQWIGFIRENDIYVLDVTGGKEKLLTPRSPGTPGTILNGKLSWVYWEEVYDHTNVPYAWSPDSTAIAYLQTDESPVAISTFVHFKPVEPVVAYQRYPKAGQPNPKVRLGIVETASAVTTWMDCGEYEYLARFNWLPNSSAIAVQTQNRKQSELKLLLAHRQTGAANLLLEEHQPAWINLNDTPYFLKNSPRFIRMSERDGYQHLYLYRLEKGKCTLERQLTKGDFMVLSSTGRLTSQNGGLVGVDEKKGIVYFTSNRSALEDCLLYRVGLDGQGLRQISDRPGVHAVQFSPGMNYYLDNYSNYSQPEELALYRANGEKIKVVTPSARELIAPWQMSAPEFPYYRAEDGLELPLMMSKPFKFDPAKTHAYPAIIYVYGGPGAQQVRDEWSSRRAFWNTILNREGYFVFTVEVRAGMAKNKAVETSVYKQAYGIQNVKDILAAVAWIKQIPAIDPDRIGIWGGSGGGCTTLFMMTHSDVFKAGISLFPVSDWNYYDSVYTERYLSTPQENPGGYRDTSCVLSAPNLKGRLFIVHGTYDDNVHPQNTYAFIDELIKHNIRFDLMIYPWRKHGISDSAGRVHMYTLMLDFWRKNL